MHKKRTGNICFLVVNVFVPLIVGMALYVVLRPDSFVSRFVYYLVGFKAPYEMTQNQTRSVFIKLLRNHLADCIWAYSLTIALLLVGKLTTFRQKWIILISVFIATIMEFSQIFNPYFTFDYMDLAAEFLGIISAWIVYMIHYHKSKYLSKREDTR